MLDGLDGLNISRTDSCVSACGSAGAGASACADLLHDVCRASGGGYLLNKFKKYKKTILTRGCMRTMRARVRTRVGSFGPRSK